MAKTPLGDIPGARFHQPIVLTHASVASNGATAVLGSFGPFAHDVKCFLSWIPAASQPGGTASYRRISLIDAGVDGTGTKVVGSLNLTASKAATTPVALSSGSVGSGRMLAIKQETVGGAKDPETVLAAGQFALSYEVL